METCRQRGGDLDLWGGRLQEQIIGLEHQQGSLKDRMGGLEQRQDSMEERMGRLEQGQEAILQVVQSIDHQLKEHKDLPVRVARLERSVFR